MSHLRTLRAAIPAHRPAAYDKYEKEIAALKAGRNDFERQVRQKYVAKLEEKSKIIDSIIQKASRIRWDRNDFGRHPFYQITLAFDPRMFGHFRLDDRELGHLAYHFGRKVEHEIRTAKFVEDAHENSRSGRFPSRSTPF